MSDALGNLFRVVSWTAKQHRRVLDLLGCRCALCGETEALFLTIDHINGGGTEHRRRCTVTAMRTAIINDPDAKKKYRTLCMSCNMAAARCTDDEIKRAIKESIYS